MRGSVALVIGVLAVARASGADEPAAESHGPPRWQAASGAPALNRIWGSGSTLYGVGSSGAYRSTDDGATWSPADGAGPANGVWGTDDSDVWIVRGRTLHHTFDGANWTTQPLPMLSFGAAMEGMWGIDRDRYVFGVDRVDGKPRGTILRSRDGGTTFRAESIPEVERIAGVWGRAANDVYAVGAKGIVLHSTGDGWTTVRAATGSNLEAIWGTASGIYAVGANGTILFSIDGKAWSPRQSGVRYTLTSISGGQELYAGSSDGAPLRSMDGVTWKPVTALIERGNVWTGGARPVLASNEVKFLGESAPIPRSVALPVASALAGTSNAGSSLGRALDSRADRYGDRYPNARALLSIAASRFGSVRPLDSRLQTLVPPKLTITSVKGCSDELDSTTPVPPGPPISITLDATCTWTDCGDVTLKARVTITDRFGKPDPEVANTRAKGACDSRSRARSAKDALDVVSIAVMQAFQKQRKDVLDASLRTASKPEETVDALAAYVLSGGTDTSKQQQLATALNQPVSWSGFVWNAGVCSNQVALAAGLKRGDDMMQAGNFGAAVRELLPLMHCQPGLASKVYLAACRAKDFVTATSMFDALGKPNSLAQICMKEGYDPRSGASFVRPSQPLPQPSQPQPPQRPSQPQPAPSQPPPSQAPSQP